ncbi:hypothetical protein KFK09_026394 [Dendrobium nobile]|uniref:Uncharacterized protein n=1 Tax=Dendrobium nobile TaxID=94219 RepID=A0A8T3A7T3_DENNO|nr:hypothetical protein KFK09_026394 [Dendrobium nobile]
MGFSSGMSSALAARGVERGSSSDLEINTIGLSIEGEQALELAKGKGGIGWGIESSDGSSYVGKVDVEGKTERLRSYLILTMRTVCY